MDPIIRQKQVRSILSTSNLPVSDYSVNTYVGCTHGCRYCYACFMKRFTGHTEAWGDFLDVKYWPHLQNPKHYAGKELFLGSVTDPYNPQEKTYLRTRELLQELQGSGVRLTIQTKSDLVLRDLDLIRSFPDARVGFSVNTLDENFRKDMDRAVSIERRLAAMRAVHAAGVRTTCFISPIFPGITDVPAIIDRVKGCCNLIWLEDLNLRGIFRTPILAYIRDHYPELFPLYDEIYARKSRRYWAELDTQIKTCAKEHGLPYVRNEDHCQRSIDEPPVIVNFFFHSEIKKSSRKA